MSTALQFHVGYNELRLVDGKLKGFYFTNREQPTKGNIILEKLS